MRVSCVRFHPLRGLTGCPVIGLCGQLGAIAEARLVPADALQSADKTFLVTGARGMIPAPRIAGRAMDSDWFGALSQWLSDHNSARRAAGFYSTPADYRSTEFRQSQESSS